MYGTIYPYKANGAPNDYYEDNIVKLNIGENIRKLRRERNLTQEQLGYELGVSFQAISRWENSTAYPDIEFLPVLAKYFGISIDELIGYDDGLKDRVWELYGQWTDEIVKSDPDADKSSASSVRCGASTSPTSITDSGEVRGGYVIFPVCCRNFVKPRK